jgi:hypothetical protein
MAVSKNSLTSATNNEPRTSGSASELKNRTQFENERRAAPTGSGTTPAVNVEDTAGELYDIKADTSTTDTDGTFRRDYVLLPDPVTGELTMTDCAAAVVQEACNFGYRPTGLASVERSRPHADGVHTVVTWCLPVQDRKS